MLLLGQSRIFYAMSRDGLIPPVYSRIHPQFRTPWLGTIVTGSIAALLAGVVPLGILGELVSIGTLLAFVIVCVSTLVLRKREPDALRPFRTPVVWLVAPLGIGMCLFMMAFFPIDTWLRLVVWTIIGLIIFALYGVRHGKDLKWVLANSLRNNAVISAEPEAIADPDPVVANELACIARWGRQALS